MTFSGARLPPQVPWKVHSSCEEQKCGRAVGRYGVEGGSVGAAVAWGRWVQRLFGGGAPEGALLLRTYCSCGGVMARVSRQVGRWREGRPAGQHACAAGRTEATAQKEKKIKEKETSPDPYSSISGWLLHRACHVSTPASQVLHAPGLAPSQQANNAHLGVLAAGRVGLDGVEDGGGARGHRGTLGQRLHLLARKGGGTCTRVGIGCGRRGRSGSVGTRGRARWLEEVGVRC